MTLASRTGFSNALQALIFRVLQGLPSAVAAYNAANSVTARALLPGPYVVAGDSSLILDLDGISVFGIIPAGSYTAGELAEALNATGDQAIGNIAGYFTASAFFAQTAPDGDFLALAQTEKGAAATVTLGAGAINPVLGWPANGRVWRWAPLRDIQEYHAWPTDLDSVDIAAYPCLRVWGESDPQNTTAAEMVEYRIDMRLYCAYGAPSAGIVDERLGGEIVALSDLIVELLYSGRIAGVDAIRISRVVLGSEIQATETGGVWRGYADFSVELGVQENLRY